MSRIKKTAGSLILTSIAVSGTIWLARDSGWTVPELWLELSFVWLGWMVTMDGCLGIKVVFPAKYYRQRSVERHGRLYEAAGVRLFKKFVVNGDYMNRFKRTRDPHFRHIRNATDAARWERDSRGAEAAHVVHLLLLLPAVALAANARRPLLLCLTVLLLVGFDLYPVLVQRYNRTRIARVTESPLLLR